VIWKPYESCCVGHALDRRARVCPDCGHPLLRCRGYDDCRQLLLPGDHCPLHVAPRLSILGRVPIVAEVGGRVAAIIRLANSSGAGSVLNVRRILKQELDGAPEDCPPDWDRLRPDEERQLAIDSAELRHPGPQRIVLYLVLGCDFGDLPEEYAFSADLRLRVRSKEESSPRIVVEGQVDGDVIAMGEMQRRRWGDKTDTRSFTPTELPCERANVFEVRQGVRGYEDGTRVLRDVEVEWRGFPPADAPPTGRPFLAADRLRGGRNSREPHERNPDPNDVSLRVYATDGSIEREKTKRISGVHLELVLLNDRLCLRSYGRNGTWVNGEQVRNAVPVPLRSGDRFRPIAPGTRGVDVEVSMQPIGGEIPRIVLERKD